MWQSYIGDEGVRCFVDFIQETSCSSINVIELIDNNLSFLACEFLAKCFSSVLPTNIQVLTLDCNKLGNQGLYNLLKGQSPPNSLEELSLQNCCLEADSMNYLGEWISNDNCKLVILNVASNDIRNEGFNILAKYLIANTSIKYVDFSNNFIGNNKESIENLNLTLLEKKHLIAYNLKMNLFTETELKPICMEIIRKIPKPKKELEAPDGELPVAVEPLKMDHVKMFQIDEVLMDEDYKKFFNAMKKKKLPKDLRRKPKKEKKKKK